MEETPLREVTQENAQKEKIMSISIDDVLVIEAAIEFGADYLYTIKYGTMGKTLYTMVPDKSEASILRKIIPIKWKGLYTIVLYKTEPISV